MPSPQIPTLPGPSFTIPPQFDGLASLAYNLWWTWNPSAAALFGHIDPPTWAKYRNPIAVLARLSAGRELARDPVFVDEYAAVMGRFERYMKRAVDDSIRAPGAPAHGAAGGHTAPDALDGPVGYFCAEYGFDEALGFYSGAVGVLAADRVKSASDLGLPFVGVGLLYKRGYFRQTVDADGHQEYAYPDYDPARLPILRVSSDYGDQLVVSIDLPGRTLYAAVWCVRVGRVPVLLLDTDIAQNEYFDRPITHILYPRNPQMRFYQALVLGIGGARALAQLRIEPAVWHLDEANGALSLPERIAGVVRSGASLPEAIERVRAATVFTTHAPVRAAGEHFEASLAEELAAACNSTLDPAVVGAVIELGGEPGAEGRRMLDLSKLALRLSRRANAVSAVHEAAAERAWQDVPHSPIVAISNGVHMPTWVAPPIRELVERSQRDELDRLSPRTAEGLDERIRAIRDDLLWQRHELQKAELLDAARKLVRDQLARHGEAPAVLEELATALDPTILTIGYGRRFAAHKRAGLLFSDVERLSRIVWNAERPIQIVVAGKGHPADRVSQEATAQIFLRSRWPQLRGRVFLLEDYDLAVARLLVSGVDVWLNTTRRRLEVSGTSGMKAAANGAINLSVLDGWWREGWTGENGWTIGGPEPAYDQGAEDWADMQDLYHLLEDTVGPLYYRRDEAGLPRDWVALMKRSMATVLWPYSSARMVVEYVERLYR